MSQEFQRQRVAPCDAIFRPDATRLSINGRAQFSGMGTNYRSSFQPKRKDINTTPMLVMHMRTTSAQTHHRLLEALVVSVGDADPTGGFGAAQ